MSQDPFNPYVSPKMAEPAYAAKEVAAASQTGVWRDGRLLVMSKTATLPNICVKSNVPVNRKLRRKLYWHHPAVYLALLVNVMIYIILSLVLRKKATIDVGLSDPWFKRRRIAIAVAWILCLSAIVMLIVGISFGGNGASGTDATQLIMLLLIPLGLVVLLGGLIGGLLIARVVTPYKIDDHYVWLKGVHPEYLARFPDLTAPQ